MALFEGYDRRIKQITSTLETYGIASLEEVEAICKGKGLDVYRIVKDVQPICFENACWAYLAGAAIAIKKGQNRAADIAETPRDRLAEFLHPRFGGRRPEGGPGTRQPGIHAAQGGNPVLRLCGGP